MMRENIFQFMRDERSKLFIPKNGGLNEYVRNMLPEIGISGEEESLEIVLARGEDIPLRVSECVSRGQAAYGLTGDDLYDEFVLSNQQNSAVIALLNTYDWFDDNAEYKRPALSLMNSNGNIEDLKDGTRVAVNRKYEKQSEKFLSERLGETNYTTTTYAGGTEETISDGTNDCCVEIIYGGTTRIENNLEVVEVVRFSDIALIGPKTPSNIWEAEYQRIEARKLNPTGSYTSQLLQDPNEIVKKFGQEGSEFIQAYATEKDLIGEALDVFYATMLALADKRVEWKQMESSLQQRWR
ncbi:MAG: phosphoribosyl-ATP diphosphatase [Nanoarchaeota archaeon]|nr:phosphoribosyl-ATP diphosphatase [Nanoarchaeota archaeon]